MKTCLKVGLLLVMAVLFAAGAALACDGGDCSNTPGIDKDQAAARPDPGPGVQAKPQAAPGMLACEGNNCLTPGIEGSAPPAAAGQKKPQPGMKLACLNENCNSPCPNDERLAAQPADKLQRLILVCLAESCNLIPDLASIMLTCGNPNCFAPVNQAEQTATR